MKKHKIKIILLFLVLVTSLISCELFTEPDTSGSGRAYIWQTDTLTTPFGSISRIWAQENPDAEWATYTGGALDKAFWQGDNKGNWSYEKKGRGITPLTIFGFAENDIWAAGSEGVIFHYDGNEWTENARINETDGKSIHFLDIWGEFPNDIYAVGSKGYNDDEIGIIYRNNGEGWNKMNINNINITFLQIEKNYNDNEIYLLGFRYSRTQLDTLKIYNMQNNNLVVLYKGVYDKKNKCGMNNIDGRVYFLIKNEVYVRENNKFALRIENTPNSDYTGIMGRNKNDILFPIEDGLIHYNGKNYEGILTLNENYVTRYTFITKNMVYLVAENLNEYKSIIYRGTKIF